MAVFQEKCWPCGKQCINAEFCGIDETYQLPRNIKVKIIANSGFWGFGGTVIEGYAHFDNSHYDFFDGFDEQHKALDCGGTGPYRNETRPDVNYRSVYDPDSATVVHYGAGGSEDGIDRGGAEVYLVDRTSQNTSDSAACSSTDPTKVFKWFPEKFGFGTKIHFHNNIYKNITGGWRLIDPTGCYDNHFTTPGGSGAYLHQCTGIDKQDIRVRDHSESTYLQYNEPSRIRPIQSGMTFHDCAADGQIAPEYSGSLSQLVRDTGDPTGVPPTNFLVATLNYGGAAASGLRNAMEILVTNDVDTTYNKAYRIFDVTHSGSSTDVSLVGTYDTGNAVNINTAGSGSWIALGTHDPSRCCGGVAYGVDSILKTSINTNYHTDFRRVFNNPKNLRQSNRALANRKNHGLDVVFRADETGVRPDKTYPSTNESGNPTLVFDRGLPYYGPFHQVDQYDGATRFNQVKNAIKARNATCYSKKAILEVFPDCVTQYERYTNCSPATDYKRNRLPRLTFVYRGCNYDDNCSFDESGRPLGDPDIYGGWTTSGPATLEDIKRGLPGQEITMFLNVGRAWGGEYQRCPCPCPPEVPVGTDPPNHIAIESPITFPCFPDFDKYPVANGCREKRFQFTQYARYVEQVGGSDLPHEECDELPTVAAACNVRQPYTTYGHISHLCGWESGNAKTTLTNAFAKERQDGTYTQRAPESGNVNEPMYWAFECPGPEQSGSAIGGTWASGTIGDNNLTNVPGEFYPYWGLTDGEGRLTTPYFHVIQNTSPGCCGGAVGTDFLDYDPVYTFFNGWPTDNVPFLIELETVDNCVGCATTVMETGSLTLSFQGLSGAYLHNVATSPGTNAYGFNHCAYRGTKLEPNWHCESGFPTEYCNNFLDDKYYLEYGSAETGNTCECIDGYSVTLDPVIIDGSDNIIIGWRTNAGSGNGFVEIPSCNNGDSKLIESDYEELPGAGYTTYAKFTVACEENIDFVDPPTFPHAYYEGSSLHNLYSCGGCTHKEPAQIAGVGNLIVKGDFFVVSNLNKDTFASLPDYIFTNAEENGLVDWPDPENNTLGENFTMCSGDRVLKYGCLLNTFYGCSGNTNACSGNTLCNTCPVDCECDNSLFVEYTDPDSGFTGRRYPPQFDLFPDCFCECEDPTLMAIFEVSGNSPSFTLNEIWRHSAACDQSINKFAPWFAVSGVDGNMTAPILNYQGPPAPYLGISLGSTYSQDWFSFSHGINKFATGISYRLDEPSTDNCGNLDPDTCATGNCTADRRARSATCLDPIAYNTGDAWQAADFNVNKKYCYPEIMVVSKVECVAGGAGYDLTVSREYHEHDRTWRQAGSIDCDCIPKFVGAYKYPDLVPVSSGTGASGEFTIDAGGTGHFTVTSAGSGYVFGGTAVIPTCVNGTTTYPCCTGTPTPAFTATFGGVNNSLTGATISPPTGYSPTGLVCNVSIIAGTGPIVAGTGCTTIPYAVPTDSVTPAYQGPCSIHPSSGTFVNQDFRLQSTSISGDPVWNYYNLFYSGDSVGAPPVAGAVNTYEKGEYYSNLPISTDPDIGCGPDCDNPDPGYWTEILFSQPLFNTPSGRFGIDATNRKHSCIQDITQCGGELWCNKLFFPRRSYKDGTKVAPFGASQICTQNAEFLNRTAFGYSDIGNADILKESTFYRYIDLCDTGIVATTQSDMGIDDIVVRVDDYLRLMGVVHPGWRYNVNMKSCTIVETGNCGGTLPPMHSDMTIHAAIHQPKTWTTDGWESFGYYLDKHGVSDSSGSGIGASGSDNCLFNPFKIMVDVECSTNNIKRRGIETDDPTLLDAIIDMPAAACEGTINPPPCSCVDSVCVSWNQRPHDICLTHYAISANYEFVESLICPCDGGVLGDYPHTHHCYESACNSGYSFVGAQGTAMSAYLFGKYVMVYGDLDPFTPVLEHTGVAATIDGTNYTYSELADEGLLAIGGESYITECPPTGDSMSGGGGGDVIIHSGYGACSGDYDFSNIFVWCGDTHTLVSRTGPFELPTWVCNGDEGTRWLANNLHIGDVNGCCNAIETREGLCSQNITALSGDIDCNSSVGDGGLLILDNWGGVTEGTWASGCGCNVLQDQDSECATDSKVRVTITQTPKFSVVTPP